MSRLFSYVTPSHISPTTCPDILSRNIMPALSDSVFNTLNFLSGYQSPELTKEAAKYDIFDYLVKSASAKDILKIVQAALYSDARKPRDSSRG